MFKYVKVIYVIKILTKYVFLSKGIFGENIYIQSTYIYFFHLLNVYFFHNDWLLDCI